MRIVWTDPSIQDLKDVRDHIARDSEYYAIEFVVKVISAVEKLVDFPQLGRVVPEIQNKRIRELLYQTYRIIYRIVDDRVEILTVIHGSRDLAKKTLPKWEII